MSITSLQCAIGGHGPFPVIVWANVKSVGARGQSSRRDRGTHASEACSMAVGSPLIETSMDSISRPRKLRACLKVACDSILTVSKEMKAVVEIAPSGLRAGTPQSLPLSRVARRKGIPRNT